MSIARLRIFLFDYWTYFLVGGGAVLIFTGIFYFNEIQHQQARDNLARISDGTQLAEEHYKLPLTEPDSPRRGVLRPREAIFDVLQERVGWEEDWGPAVNIIKPRTIEVPLQETESLDIPTPSETN